MPGDIELVRLGSVVVDADLEQGGPAGASAREVLGLRKWRAPPGLVALGNAVVPPTGLISAATTLLALPFGVIGSATSNNQAADNDGADDRFAVTAKAFALIGGAAAGTFLLATIAQRGLDAVEDSQPDDPLAGVLTNVINFALPDKQQAVRDHLVSNWTSLRPHFRALVGTDALARASAAETLAGKRDLNDAVGSDAARLPDARVAMGLLDDLKDVLNRAGDPSPLRDQQYMDVAARLAELVDVRPLQAFWQLQSVRRVDELPANALPELQLAAALLANAGCAYSSIRDALNSATPELAPPAYVAVGPTAGDSRDSADIGDQSLSTPSPTAPA